MIGKKNRFHGHRSLNFVYSKGKSVRTPMLVLKFVASQKNDYRLAVVVSKKISKSAVVRNRIRRRLYEIVRVIKKEDQALWPYDLVLSVYDERVAPMPAEELRAQVVSLLKKSGITQV